MIEHDDLSDYAVVALGGALPNIEPPFVAPAEPELRFETFLRYSDCILMGPGPTMILV